MFPIPTIFRQVINLFSQQPAVVTQNGARPLPQEGFQRLPSIVQRFIFDKYLTNADRKNCLAVRVFRQEVLETKTHKAFVKLMPLIRQQCQRLAIQNQPLQNPPPAERDYLPYEAAPKFFSCFNYDFRSQHLITGEYNNSWASWAGRNSGMVKVWNARTGKMIHSFTSCITSHKQDAICVQLDMQNGQALSVCRTGAGCVRVWDFNVNGVSEVRTTYPLDHPHYPREPGEASCVSANFAENCVLVGSSAGSIVSIDDEGPHAFSERHSTDISWLCDAPKIGRVFSASERGGSILSSGSAMIKIWDRVNRTSVFTLKAISNQLYHPEHGVLFVGMASSGCVRQLNPLDGQEIRTFHVPQDDVGVQDDCRFDALHYDATTRWLFASTWPSEKEKHRAAWGRKIVVWDATTGAPLHTLLLRKCSRITQLDFDPAAQTLLTAGHGVALWDLSGACISSISEGFDARVQWDREHSALVCLDKPVRGQDRNTALSVLRYGPDALQAKDAEKAKPESKESKKE